MEQNFSSSNAQTLSIILEIVLEDENDPGPAALNTLGSSIFKSLTDEGYTLKTISTPKPNGRKEKGVLELLFQVIPTAAHLAQAVGADILAQKDTISVLSGLCGIFTTVRPLVLRLLHVHEKQPAQCHRNQQDQQMKVSICINGAKMEITSSDMASDEHIVQLAERLLAVHPTVKAPPQSKVKICGRVPKRKRHR